MNEKEIEKWIKGKTAYEVFSSINKRIKDLTPQDQKIIWDIYERVNEFPKRLAQIQKLF